jgi:hypothetical protein
MIQLFTRQPPLRNSPALGATAPRRAGARVLATAGALLLAAGCVPTNPDVPLRGDRAQAQDVAARYVAARDPVIDPTPAASCIARHATGEEIGALLAGGEVEPIVREVVRRQSTQTCFAQTGVPDFGLDLLIA